MRCLAASRISCDENFVGVATAETTRCPESPGKEPDPPRLPADRVVGTQPILPFIGCVRDGYTVRSGKYHRSKTPQTACRQPLLLLQGRRQLGVYARSHSYRESSIY